MPEFQDPKILSAVRRIAHPKWTIQLVGGYLMEPATKTLCQAHAQVTAVTALCKGE